MPEEQRRPFRTIGMRMQRFSQSLMRSYVPPSEELPSVENVAPVWQPASQIPLDWGKQSPAAPASVPPVSTSSNDTPVESPSLPASTPASAEVSALPAAPTPAAPVSPKPQTVQRMSAPPAPAAPSKSTDKQDARLLAILAAHNALDAKRENIRDEKKSKIEAAEEAFDANNQVTLQRSRRSRASFDYIETSALAKGEDAPSVSHTSHSDSSPSPAPGEPADDADDDSAPSAQASGPPDISRAVEAVETVRSQSTSVPEIDAPQAPSANEEAAFIAPDAENITQPTEAPVEAPHTDVPTPAVTAPNSAAEVIQRSASPVPTVNQSSPSTHFEATKPQPPVTPAVSNTEPEVIQRAEVPETLANTPIPVVPSPESESSQPPAAQVIQRAEVSTEPTVQSSSTDKSVIPPAVTTSVQSPTSPTIQRTSAPVAAQETSSTSVSDVPAQAPAEPALTAPEVIQLTEAPVEPVNEQINEPIAQSTVPTSITETIQRIEAPAEPITPASSQPVTANHAVDLTHAPTPVVPEVIQPPAAPIEPAITSDNDPAVDIPTASAPTPAEPIVQRKEAPQSIPSVSPESTKIPPARSEVDAPPAPPAPVVTPSIQRDVEPDIRPSTPFASTDDSPAPQIELMPDVSAAEPPIEVQPPQGTWHLPDTVQRSTVTTSPEAPSTEPTVEANRGMWHVPDETSHSSPPIVDDKAAVPAQPTISETIQRAEAPIESNTIQPSRTDESPTVVDVSASQAPLTVNETLQRAQAPAPISPDQDTSAPDVSVPTATEPTAADRIQNAQTSAQVTEPLPAQASAPEVIRRAETPVDPSPAVGQNAPPVITPPTVDEAIQRAQALPEATSNQPIVDSQNSVTTETPVHPVLQPTVPEVIQRTEVPIVEASSPLAPEEEAAVETPLEQPTINRTIQRAEAPTVETASPLTSEEVAAVETPPLESEAPITPVEPPMTQPTPAEVIRRVEAPVEVDDQQSFVTHDEVVTPEASTNAIAPSIPAEIVQPAWSPEPIDMPLPSSDQPTSDIATQPATPQVIQRAEVPAEPAPQAPEVYAGEPPAPMASAHQPLAPAEVVDDQPPIAPDEPAAASSVQLASAQPPTAADVIQRAQAPEPVTSTPVNDVHEIDLFEALNSGHFDAPSPTPTAETPTVNQPPAHPVIQRTLDETTVSAPLTAPEPDAVMPEPETEIETPAAIMRRAVDDELLSLLEGMQSSRGNQPPPASPSDTLTSAPAPTSIVQRQMEPPVYQQAVQRHEVLSTPHIQRAETSDSDENGKPEVDIDRLARDVYKMLQNRLRIERERRDRI